MLQIPANSIFLFGPYFDYYLSLGHVEIGPKAQRKKISFLMLV